MRNKSKIAVALAFMAGGGMFVMMGGSVPTTLSRPYYYFVAPATVNVVIKPSSDIYTYSLVRTGGTDTVSVWYLRNSTDSTLYRIPPPLVAGGERVITFAIGPPIRSKTGIRVLSGSATSLIVSGGY
jgi:hypothetical protein